jgi:hypothetical protein
MASSKLPEKDGNLTIDFQALLAQQESAMATSEPSSETPGETRVMKISKWSEELGDGCSRWSWNGDAQPTATEEGGELLELPGFGTMLRELPGLDPIRAAKSGGLALELTLPAPARGVSAGLVLEVGDAAHGSVALVVAGGDEEATSAGECRVTLSSQPLDSAPGAAPAPGNVLGSRDVPAAASFLMRLELEPGGRGVVGLLGANENCLRIIGRVSLEESAIATCGRGGVAAFQAADVPPVATRFGAFTVDVLAADRLTMNGGGGGGGRSGSGLILPLSWMPLTVRQRAP